MRPPPKKTIALRVGERTYSSFEIMRALEIPKEKLRDWIDRGFITASIPSPGRGRPAGFTKSDIYGLALFIQLLYYGFPRESAARMVESYRAQYDIYYPGDKNREPDTWRRMHEPSDFIIFRNETDKTVIFGTVNEKWNISMRTGDVFPEGGNTDKEDSKSWDSILIINYKKIRDGVDEALAKL